jgi:hypothetical protein
MDHPLLAASDWGITVAIGVVLALFLIVGWIIVQGTRAQLYWRRRAAEGDVDTITMLVNDELSRWKVSRTPKGVEPEVWRGVQSAELVGVTPEVVRLSATAEGQYAMSGGERREVTSALSDGMKITARLADMALYEVPNVQCPAVQIDVYSTFRDEAGSSQRCILTTVARREVASGMDWDGMPAEDIVRRFGGRYLLDDHGNPKPIDPNAAGAAVPAAFYKDD